MELLDKVTAAKLYTRAGIVVHPLSPPNDAKQSPGKRPILKAWQSMTKPPGDRELEHWFKAGDYNIGAVCGQASDLMVIDVDWYIPGMWEDILRGIDTSQWITQQRTPERWHWLFKFNPSFELQHVKPLGIDLLGEAGNVVMAPSVHESLDVYQLSGDISKRPDIPEEVINRLQVYIKRYNDLITCINRCRPTFKNFFNAVFVDHKNQLYHDLTVFRNIDGRQRTLHLCAELVANGANHESLMLLCMMAFGEAYREDKSIEGLKGIKGTATARTESIMKDPILSTFYQPGKQPKKESRDNSNYYTVKIKSNGETTIGLNYPAIAEGIRREYNVISYADKVYVYEGGYYKQGETRIKAEIQRIAKDGGFSGPLKKATDEIMHYIMYEDPAEEYPFNGIGVIPVLNGVISLDYENEKVTLLPHSPEYKFNFILPVEYDPEAPDTVHEEMICRYVEEKYRDALYQIPAQAILQTWSDPFKKAYLIQGDPNAGKSTYLYMIETLFGLDNISGESLHSLSENHFAKSSLEGKMFNIYDDLSDIPMKDTGEFKTLTGKRIHNIERKGKQAYVAPITAVHIYTCNAPPSFDKKVKMDTAFWDRWEYTVFPYVFGKDPGFTKRMFTPENVSGFFNRILKMVMRIKNSGLPICSTASEVREMWSFDSDPLYQYLKEQLEFGDKRINVEKEPLLKAIQAWALANDVDMAKIPSTPTALTQALDKYDVTAKRVTNFAGVQVHTYELPGQWKLNATFSATRVVLKTEQGRL